MPQRALTVVARCQPPGTLQRFSLLWLGIAALLGYTYVQWLPVLPSLREEATRGAIKATADLSRFWHTHVTLPLPPRP